VALSYDKVDPFGHPHVHPSYLHQAAEGVHIIDAVFVYAAGPLGIGHSLFTTTFSLTWIIFYGQPENPAGARPSMYACLLYL